MRSAKQSCRFNEAKTVLTFWACQNRRSTESSRRDDGVPADIPGLVRRRGHPTHVRADGSVAFHPVLNFPTKNSGPGPETFSSYVDPPRVTPRTLAPSPCPPCPVAAATYMSPSGRSGRALGFRRRFFPPASAIGVDYCRATAVAVQLSVILIKDQNATDARHQGKSPPGGRRPGAEFRNF